MRLAFFAPRHPENSLNLRVERVQFRMADRPVVADPFLVQRLELPIAHPERLPSPKKRPSPHQPHPDPVIGRRRIVRVRNLLLVHPLVGVELIRLHYMRQTSGLIHTPVRQLPRVLGDPIRCQIHFRPRIQHQAGNPLLRQNLRSHAPGVAGANDQNVKLLFRHAYPL